MRYHEFVERVQEEGDFDSQDEALRGIEATLSSLGECLYRTERRHLASQLPKPFEEALYAYVESEVTRQGAACLSLQEFYDRVGARADVTRGVAIEQANAVTAVLERVLPEGEWRHIILAMPKAYHRLLTPESDEAGTSSA